MGGREEFFDKTHAAGLCKSASDHGPASSQRRGRWHEILIPTYKKENGSWSESKYIPLANMVGIKRAVKATVAYLGDSITQGIGVDENDYSFWSAVTSQKLGNDFAYWNLGIGYARCSDAATDGSWLFKAKQAEYVIVCLGTNDIASDYADGPTLCADLEKVVDALNAEHKPEA